MDILFDYQEAMLKQVDARFSRSLFDHIEWDQRLFGITGLRGTGKTTMLLQYLKYRVEDGQRALYVSADYTWFYDNNLVGLADQFVKYGGRLLLIDEIHKYPRWSRELKNIYDLHPELKIVFTASSVLDILRGEADLSRRAVTYELPGLSLREYLALIYQIELPAFSLHDLLTNPKSAAATITDKIKPLPYFKEYIRQGYFPFIRTEKEILYYQKLNQIINTVLEIDLHFVQGYSSTNVSKMKKLLGVLAESAPFTPNVSKLADQLGLGRDTVKTYFEYLEKARILNLASIHKKGVAGLKKPDKIFLENTNLSFAMQQNPDKGTLRETFFINQITNAGYEVGLGEKADFVVNDSLVFEIGGQSKDHTQLEAATNGYLAIDDVEHAYMNRIPLWLFGFLY